MRRWKLLTSTIGVLAATAVAMSPTPAAAVGIYHGATLTPVPSPLTLQPSPFGAVFTAASGTITCSTSGSIDVTGANPHVTAVEYVVSSMSFSNCSDSLPAVTVAGIFTNGLPRSGRVTAAADWVVDAPSWTVQLAALGTCVYAPTATFAGFHSNASGLIHFTNRPLALNSGGPFCPASLTLTASYDPAHAAGSTIVVL